LLTPVKHTEPDEKDSMSHSHRHSSMACSISYTVIVFGVLVPNEKRYRFLMIIEVMGLVVKKDSISGTTMVSAG
jgi:hypothetical protein